MTDPSGATSMSRMESDLLMSRGSRGRLLSPMWRCRHPSRVMGIILASTNGQDGPEGILGRGELEGPARHWRRPTRSNHERESI